MVLSIHLLREAFLVYSGGLKRLLTTVGAVELWEGRPLLVVTASTYL